MERNSFGEKSTQLSRLSIITQSTEQKLLRVTFSNGKHPTNSKSISFSQSQFIQEFTHDRPRQVSLLLRVSEIQLGLRPMLRSLTNQAKTFRDFVYLPLVYVVNFWPRFSKRRAGIFWNLQLTFDQKDVYQNTVIPTWASEKNKFLSPCESQVLRILNLSCLIVYCLY